MTADRLIISRGAAELSQRFKAASGSKERLDFVGKDSIVSSRGVPTAVTDQSGTWRGLSRGRCEDPRLVYTHVRLKR